MKTKILGSLIASFLIAGAAQAQQVISYFAQIPQATTNWTQTLQLPSFDSGLGTLTQVKLSYTGDVWQSLFAENTSLANASTYNLTTTATLTLGKQGGPTLFAPTPIAFNRAGPVLGYDGNLDFGGTSGVTFNQQTTVNGTYFDGDLPSYLGLGPINFVASASGLSTLISGGNFVKGALTSAATGLSVEYTFTAIPEPSAYAAIFGAAALAFVTIRRRLVRSID
mgnify:CR=1 FL=1